MIHLICESKNKTKKQTNITKENKKKKLIYRGKRLVLAKDRVQGIEEMVKRDKKVKTKYNNLTQSVL